MESIQTLLKGIVPDIDSMPVKSGINNSKANKIKPNRIDPFKDADTLKKAFLYHFKKEHGIAFQGNGNNHEVLETICLYLARDNRFLEHPLIQNDQIIPSFNRGLALYGPNGNGKTAMMRIFSKLSLHRPVQFTVKRTDSLTKEFRSISDPDYFISNYSRYTRLFDDVLYERNVKYYGEEINLMEKILFERNEENVLTHITFNTPENYTGSFDQVIDQFLHRYDKRTYDRMFDMFTFIELKGKSLRGRTIKPLSA